MDFARWGACIALYCLFSYVVLLGGSTGGCGDEQWSCAAGTFVNFHEEENPFQ